MQKYHVEITEPAELDLIEIYEYLINAVQAEPAATNLLKEITTRIQQLTIFPNGSPIYDTVPKYRMMHIKNFKVIYRVDESENTVYIMKIAHSLQDI